MTGRGIRSGRVQRDEPRPSCASKTARELDTHGRRESALPSSLKQDPIENGRVVGDRKLAWARQMQEGELR